MTCTTFLTYCVESTQVMIKLSYRNSAGVERRSGRGFSMTRMQVHILLTDRVRITPVPRSQEALCCSLIHCPCSQPCLVGQELCSAYPRRQECALQEAKNGKRCPSAAPKPEKKDGVPFCAEHARGDALVLHAQAKETSPGLLGEAFLCQLSSHGGTELGLRLQDVAAVKPAKFQTCWHLHS